MSGLPGIFTSAWIRAGEGSRCLNNRAETNYGAYVDDGYQRPFGAFVQSVKEYFSLVYIQNKNQNIGKDKGENKGRHELPIKGTVQNIKNYNY